MAFLIENFQHARRLPGEGIGDHEHFDLPLYHDGLGFMERHILGNNDRRGRHEPGNRQGLHIGVLQHGPANVSIRDDPRQILSVHYENRSQSPLGHRQQALVKQTVWINDRQVPVHGVPNLGEKASPQKTSWVEPREVGRLEVPGLNEGDGQGIPHGHRGSGGGRGSQVERANFPFYGNIQDHTGGPAEGGLRPGGHGDNRHAELPEAGQQTVQLWRFSAVGNEKRNIVGTGHSQIPVEGIPWVKKEGGSARGGKSRRNFSGHQSRLADSGNNHSPFSGEDEIHGFIELVPEPFGQSPNRPGLGNERPAGYSKVRHEDAVF